MIDSRQLMKGNWVLFSPSGKKAKTSERPVRVISLLEESLISLDNGLHLELFYESSSVKPIPLSSDILLAVGFEKLKGTKDVYSILIDDTEISININLHYLYIDTDWGQASIKKPIFKYLHQVQNIIYSLTNKEIEYSPK